MIDTLAKVSQHYAAKGGDARTDDFNQVMNQYQPPPPQQVNI